jgi:hypothetical protein
VSLTCVLVGWVHAAQPGINSCEHALALRLVLGAASGWLQGVNLSGEVFDFWGHDLQCGLIVHCYTWWFWSLSNPGRLV